MSAVMRIVWLYFLLRRKLGLAKIGQPPRSPAQPNRRQLRGLKISKHQIDGFTVYSVQPAVSNRTVVYLHGGGYVQPIASQHWDLITRLARETNSRFEVVCYGLSPAYTVDMALKLLEKVKARLSGVRPIVLMGDSAGGGLALAIAQNSWNFLSKLILISPWVDSEFSEEVKLYAQRDPWLNPAALQYIATVWSGVGSWRRLEVSPLRGSMRGLPPTTLFIGDYELFYPDVMKLAEKMKQEGVSVNLDFQAGGMHVYPLIPSREGNRALQVLKRDLLEVSERVTGIEPA
ncbi:MAG: hypothetical protein RIR89_522 [Actinomycetota bacterium]